MDMESESVQTPQGLDNEPLPKEGQLIKEQVMQLTHQLQGLGKTTAALLQEIFRDWGRDAQGLYQQGYAKARSAEKSAEVSIGRHPIMAIVLAAFLGWILGLLSHGREAHD